MNTATTDTTSKSPLQNLTGFAKVLVKLAPRQVEDQLRLALLELKKKGIGIGIAAGLFVGALIFLSFVVTSLIVALIAGIADQGNIAVKALFVALGFFVLLLILALIGMLKLKKSLPLKPSRAIYGLKYDLGVVEEGEAFNPQSLRDPRTKQQRKADAERAAAEKKEKARQEKIAKGIDPDAPAPTINQLVARTSERRRHIGQARDGLISEVPAKYVPAKKTKDPHAPSKVQQVKEQATHKFGEVKEQASDKFQSVKGQATEKLESAKAQAEVKLEQAKAKASEARAKASEASASQVGTSDPAVLMERAKERKGALATAGVSLGIFAVLANALGKKKKK